MELFNSHCASQCTPLNNSSALLALEYKTNGWLASVNIKEDYIYLILKNLNSGKAHGWGNISIRIIQLCGKAIVEPLRISFLSFLEEEVDPDDWKKSNIAPTHKKESKNLIKNYRPISLLPVFSKVFERIIFNSLVNYSHGNTECQSGFLPGDSCISQLPSIMHKIYKSFACNPLVDVRGAFLEISKAFDKVWHDGLIYKLKSYGVPNKLINLIQNYMTNRQQRVLLSGKT